MLQTIFLGPSWTGWDDRRFCHWCAKGFWPEGMQLPASSPGSAIWHVLWHTKQPKPVRVLSWDTNKSRKRMVSGGERDATACSSTWLKFYNNRSLFKIGDGKERDWIKRDSFVLLRWRMPKGDTQVHRWNCEKSQQHRIDLEDSHKTPDREKDSKHQNFGRESYVLSIRSSHGSCKSRQSTTAKLTTHIKIWIMKTGKIERERERKKKTNQLQHCPEFAKWCLKHMLETRDI